MVGEEVDVLRVAALKRRVLPYGDVPQVEDLLVVDAAELGEVVVEEVADQLVDGSGGHVARDHAEEALEHLAERLNEDRGLVGDEEGELGRVDGADDELGVELDLHDDVGDERDHRPQDLGVVDVLEDAQGDR